jgi:hypothetical protein
MIEDHVGELRLRVRTDVPDSAELRPAVERIVRAALERCAALLETRVPGRVVLLRRLPLRWSLDSPALEDPAVVDDLAQAAADAIERTALPVPLDPPAHLEGALVFDNEAHLRASHLLARARSRPAWFHAALETPAVADPLAALTAPAQRITAQATLRRLAQEDVLAEVLASHPAPAVAALAAALDGDGPLMPAPSPLAAALAGRPTRNPLATQLAATASRWPALAPAARALALQVHAAVLLESDLHAPAARALASAVLAEPEPPPGVPVAPPSPQPPPVPRDRRADADTPQADPPAAEPDPSAALLATQCAGLFYFLERVQELDLAESLWKACLPEGAVFAAAAAALLGPRFATDIAPAVFGGVEPPVACPHVTLEQLAEIAATTCAAVAAALPRRGLAEIPPVLVTLADHPAGRLLAAAAEGSPFVFFAWPAATRDLLSAGLRALLAAWPHPFPLHAAPALVTLDPSGRLQPRPESHSTPLLLPGATTAPAAALLALVAGAPGQLFAARAGAPTPDTVEAFVDRYLACPARLRLGPERLDVLLRADQVAFAVRRAGLDRDPGWIPWLRRSVQLVFEEPVAVAQAPPRREDSP